VSECDREVSIMRMPWHTGGCRATEKYMYIYIHIYMYIYTFKPCHWPAIKKCNNSSRHTRFKTVLYSHKTKHCVCTYPDCGLADLGVGGSVVLKWIFGKRDGSIGWIELAQDRDRWRALVNAVLDLRFPQNMRKFLTS
jgi:hypothetical protein